MIFSRLRPAVRDLYPSLVAWRRQIHQQPELGFAEVRTAALIQQLLQDWGIPHQAGVAQTGVVATISGSRAGKTLAIRADMDGLPIQEDNPVPYRSQVPQRMHACGHDGHVAIALGTAKLLWEQRQRLPGQVKIVFQPAEESPGGAKPMIAAGVVQDVDAMLGLHLWNNLPLGTVGVKSGPAMANTDRFYLQILGKGGHGAMPHQTVDALVVGCQVVSALQTIVARSVDPLQPAVVTVGKFQAGDTFNVIAAKAELWGTVRTFDPDTAELIPKRLEEIVAGICQAYGALYHLDYERTYPAVSNHPQLAALVEQAARDTLGEQARIHPEMTMGGEDMAFFLEKVPGCYFFLGSANPELGLTFPHHHPRFDFDETALPLGVELFLRCTELYFGIPTP
ncbi:MAG: M20 family metallopeptidase [Thermostichales cyanobacterium BF4_bins_65]